VGVLRLAWLFSAAAKRRSARTQPLYCALALVFDVALTGTAWVGFTCGRK
jgi:hypothetical protein